MKTKIKAEIVAHSINEQGDELISVLATFPRIILAEVNTHRMLSKNTSSSRAIPFNKMVEAIQNDPFIPIAWQKEHKGMQGTEYLTEQKFIDFNTGVWLRARYEAVNRAKELNGNLQRARSFFDTEELENTGVTKQLCNRLLEPFMWTTMLITGSKSGWENFFNLRCPNYQYLSSYGTQHYKSKKEFLRNVGLPDSTENYKNYTDLDWLKLNKGQAEIHMMALAESIYDAVNESTPKQLKPGEWHIPFEDKLSRHNLSLEDMIKCSVSMAARTSYTVVGDEKEIDYQKMIDLHDRLLSQNPPHSSPLEHCAKAMTEEEYYKVFYKHLQFPGEGNTGKDFGWCNNFKGFIPYRYMVDNG